MIETVPKSETETRAPDPVAGYIQPPLSDYAMIGDCRSCALVAKSGSIDWLCLPDFSSPSVFAAILDAKKGGRYVITLSDLEKSERRYLPETGVLETTLHGKSGTIRLTDCMPVSPNGTQLEPLREILRSIEVVTGNPSIEVLIDPRPDYARKKGRFKRRGHGWALTWGPNFLHLESDFPLQLTEGILHGHHAAEPGKIFWFSMTFDAASPCILLPIGAEAHHRVEATRIWWQQWANQIRYEGPFRNELVRSAIILRQLAFSISGGLLAAASMSLPEAPGGFMNWDYRYCWPRDAALTLSAFIDIGLRDEGDAFFGWLMIASNVTKPRLKVMYDVYGRYKIDEHILPHLDGYRGAKPVRRGNKLQHQVQHDVYGEVLMAVENWTRHFGKPKPREIELFSEFGNAVCQSWRDPDNGIWEKRDKKRHYTYSKVMAWYVLDCLLKLHDRFDFNIPVDKFTIERDALRIAIETDGYNKAKNCFTNVFGEDGVDAALLLMPRTGFIEANDPRMKGTWEAIQDQLETNGLIRRYPPGFAGSEVHQAAFVICNFWAIDYLAMSGDGEGARARFMNLLSYANDVGIYTEGIMPETGESCGNLPQAFSHAGLINTILNLEAAGHLP